MPIEKSIPLDSNKRTKDILPYLKSPILDVGCSNGYDVNYFKNLGFEVEGCDINSSAIESAGKNYPQCHFFFHDFEQNALEKKYNTIYAFDVIEHIFDYNTFLKNIAKALNERGRLILTTPNVLSLKYRLKFLAGDGALFNQMPHIRFFTPATIKEVLNQNGFKVIKVFGYSRLPLPTSLCGSLTIIAEVST